MLSQLHLKNFKAFQELDIDLKPITVFLGANNSGKSSILAAPRLLSQTLESFDPNVTLLLNGVFGDFGTYRDIVFGKSAARHIDLGVCFDRGERNLTLGIPQRSRMDLSFKYRSSLKEIVLKQASLTCDNEPMLSAQFSQESERHIVEAINGVDVPSKLRSPVSRTLRMQHFIPSIPLLMIGTENMALLESIIHASAEKLVRKASRGARRLHAQLKTIEYIGAMRVPPERSFLFSGERRTKVGASGQYSIPVMALDSFKRGSRSKGIRNKVVSWLHRAGIADDLKIKTLSDRHYEIYIKHPGTHEYSNFADVGYGNSQVIPVLIGGYNLVGGETFIVEEPEIHLHPKAQAELGEFFLELNKKKVQSLIETHSEYLVLRLQQHVAAGNISNQDIAFYYVFCSEGEKRVKRMHLNQKGSFTEEWPEGFFPERLEEAKKLSLIRASV